MGVSPTKLTATFGAELAGLDLRHPDDEMLSAVREAWLKHGILVFHDQQLSDDDIVSFSRAFGDLEIHVRREYLLPEHPEILLVSNIVRDGKPIGILSDNDVGWHYDQIYLPRPAVGSFLYAAQVPPEGGCTYFADMAAAFEALPDALKQRIEGRTAIQSYEAFNRAYSVPANEEQKKRTTDIEQPIVRTHPLTGRRALYICPGMTIGIVGLAEDESADVLEGLFEWSVRPEFVYRHEWRAGDGILWDNACTMHRRDPFDGTHERLMKRTTILPPAHLAVPF